MSWQPRNTASHPQRATRSTSYCHNLMTWPQSPYHQCAMLTNLTDRHVAATERQLKPNTIPHRLAVEAENQRPQDTPMTYDKTWIIELVRPDLYMDQRAEP